MCCTGAAVERRDGPADFCLTCPHFRGGGGGPGGWRPLSLRGSGEANGEGGAGPSAGAVCGDPAPVGFDDGFGDGQADAAAKDKVPNPLTC